MASPAAPTAAAPATATAGTAPGADLAPGSRMAGYLVDVAGLEGGWSVADFAEAFQTRLQKVVTAELHGTPYEGRPCPWIPYVAERYRGRPAHEVSRTIRLYLGGREPASAEEALSALAERARQHVRQWIASGAPPVPPPGSGPGILRWASAAGSPARDASAVWSLGPGRPLEPHVRSRMEGALGASLDAVRLHDHPAAHDLARDTHAHAFAVGREIGFGRGRYRPGTPTGDAILAHELAHTLQTPGTAADTARLEADATLQATRAVARLWLPRSLASLLRFKGTGPQPAATPGSAATHPLRRCPWWWEEEPPSVDWRSRDDPEYDEVMSDLQSRQAEIQEVLARPNLTDADFARLDQLYADVDGLLLELRLLGDRRSDDELLAEAESGRSGPREIHLLEIRGAEPTPIHWGERRRFEVDLDWVPPNVDLFVEWFVEGTNGEWVATLGMPPQVTDANPTGALTFGKDVWMGPVGQEILRGTTSQMRVIAKLKVAGDAGYESVLATDPLEVDRAVPETLTILANGVNLPASPPPVPGTAPPAGTPPPSSPAEVGWALAGVNLEFQLSWIAPPVGSPGGGHVVEWEHVPPPPRLSEPPVFQDSNAPVTARYTAPGRHTIHARVRPVSGPFSGITPTRAPIAEASLTFDIVEAEDLSRRGLEAFEAAGVATFASSMRDLDREVADLDASIAAGSPAIDRLQDRREALATLRSRMSEELGDAPTPLPASGPLDPTHSYVAPIPAVMAVPEARGVVPLRLFLRLEAVGSQWHARIVDTTTQDVVHFEGFGGSELEAVRAAIADWRDDNEYPQGGTVRYSIRVLGTVETDHFSTNSFEKSFWEWFDRILFFGQAIAAIALLVTPEPTGATKAAGLALLAVGVMRSMVRIYQSLDLGRPVLDERNVLEALSILAAALGLGGAGTAGRAAGTALQGEALSARALTQFQLGRGLLLTGAALDAGSFVWVAHGAYNQMRAIAADESLPESEREARINAMVAQLAAQGLLMVGTNASLFHATGPRGTRAPFVEAMGELRIDPVMRSRMEVTLRRFGDTSNLADLAPRQLLERYLAVQRARSTVNTEIADTGGTRGLGVYDPAPVDATTGRGPQSAATVERAAAPFVRRSPADQTRLQNVRVDGDVVRAELVVEVPATASTPADTLTVQVRIAVPATLGDTGPHGADSGMARLSVGGDAASGWRLNIDLDSRLATEADVRNNLAHELREGARTIRDGSRDPDLDLAAEAQPRVFGPGPASGTPSAHDHAHALEFRDLFDELAPALSTYDRARTAAAGARGTAIPDSGATPVRTAGEAAYRRLDAALDAMGFADPAHRAAKRTALLAEIGLAETSPLARYLDGYASRATERVRRNAELAALDEATRTSLFSHLPADLAEHVSRRVPAQAVGPLGRAMGRNDAANNSIRNALREALRQHRSGRITDAGLIEAMQRLDAMTANYRAQLGESTHATALSRAFQADPPRATSALDRLEQTLVEAGVTTPPAAPGGPSHRIYPESDLVGTGKHGIGWSDGDARGRASDVREDPDQGRFGSLADVWYAVQCARQLAPAGDPSGGPYVGAFFLPAGHHNVVFRRGVADPVVPDAVFVKVDSSGRVHAYPADSTHLNLGATGPVRPAVTW